MASGRSADVQVSSSATQIMLDWACQELRLPSRQSAVMLQGWASSCSNNDQLRAISLQDWDIAGSLEAVFERRESSGQLLAGLPKLDLAARHITEALSAARKRTAGAIGAPKVAPSLSALRVGLAPLNCVQRCMRLTR